MSGLDDTKKIHYYSVSCSELDEQNPELDLLCELRKEFFESGIRQKNKVVRTALGVSYRYSYSLEAGQAMKWKKMACSRLLQKSQPGNEGSYRIISYGKDRKIDKIAYFNNEHDWEKTEYFLEKQKKIPSVIISPSSKDEGLVVCKYNHDTAARNFQELYAEKLEADEAECSALNASLGVPFVFCCTNEGNFYYCDEEEMEARKSMLQKLRENNVALLSSIRGNGRDKSEEIPKEEQQDGFQVQADTLGGWEENDSQEENMLQQDDTYRWGSSKDIENKNPVLLVEKEEDQKEIRGVELSSKREGKEGQEEESLDQILDSKQLQDQIEQKLEEVRSSKSKTDFIAEEPENREEQCEPVIERPETAYTYTNLYYKTKTTAMPYDGKEGFNPFRLSPDHREKIRKYNVAVHKIKKKNMLDFDQDSKVVQQGKNKSFSDGASFKKEPKEIHKTCIDRANEQEEIVLSSLPQMPYVLRPIEKQALLCPAWQEPDKIIHVGEKEEYYYFGEVKDGYRTGRGRTAMDDGKTAYEGDYQNDMRNGFGVYYYKTGKLCYAGNWKDNKRDGIGASFQARDKSIYITSWQQDQPVGMGAQFDEFGNLIIAAKLEHGLRQGAGVQYLAEDGSIFVEQWKDGRKTGKVTQFDQFGNLLYTGDYQKAKRNGFGVLYRQDGSIVYSGQWKENQYHGEGALFFEDGRKVKGTFVEGQLCGYGTELREDGLKVYEGFWQNNQYHGEGRRFFENGESIQGTFAYGIPDGILSGFDKDGALVYKGHWDHYEYSAEGTYYENGEKIYEGSFLHSAFHGFGNQYKNGSCIYSGQFESNERKGIGTSYLDGQMEYFGQWDQNQYNGFGVFYQNGQAKYVGCFVNGKKHGRINEIRNGAVYRECIFKNDVMVYLNEYELPDKNLVYQGNVQNGKPNGMGCMFIPYGEKLYEGIFSDGKLVKSMKVSLRTLDDLPRCDALVGTDYERFRVGPNFVVEQNLIGGIYSGLLLGEKPNGKGTVLYSDHRYTGDFVNGSALGFGVIYQNDGTKLEGEFFNEPGEKVKTLTFLNGKTYYFFPRENL